MPRSFLRCIVMTIILGAAAAAQAQTVTPAMLEEASRRTGMSKDELLRQYGAAGGAPEAVAVEPGRTSMQGINDADPTGRWRDTEAKVVLPLSELQDLKADGGAPLEQAQPDPGDTFGANFFHLDEGVFQPPSFGPVPADYRLGVGDELVINAWGEIDFQLTRVVDRDGSILLPRSGKVVCAGRTLSDVGRSIRDQLARSHASIGTADDTDEGAGATQVEVTLGQLRSIRIYVIGNAVRPGSYQLSSASSVLTALYASGGPTPTGSFRDIRLMRGTEVVSVLDLYGYLTRGERSGDHLLQEGDTVFIPDRLRRVQVTGPVRRPMFYEMKANETLTDLLAYAGGLTPQAVPNLVHIRRILAAKDRQPGQPDHVLIDVSLADGAPVPGLLDADVVVVDNIGDRLDGYIDVKGSVKMPGRYEYREGLTVSDLVAMAGNLWPDAMTDKAIIDRTSPSGDLFSLTVPLGDMLAGRVPSEPIMSRDVLHIFARWELQRRPPVHITGEVYNSVSPDWRGGMTLRELVLKAGGLKDSANLLEAEVSRLRQDAVMSTDTSTRPEQTVEVLRVPLGTDFLANSEGFALEPYDRVVIRRLPWWELQRTVTVRGEVFYPGQFSLERQDERLSTLIARAGGLKPDAYLPGARVQRSQDGVGNVAIDLKRALDEPGSEQDIIVQAGDEVIIPDRMFTVKVLGEVGFPTSLVYEDGKKINWYVDHAGGYLEKADKGKSRVVWPNGMSLPNKGGSKVIAGSTIIVPRKAPPEGTTTLETLKEISGILAGLATVWLVIDRTK